MSTDRERIEKALEIAFTYAQIDGAHHKTWCIDQMVRVLTGCPDVEVSAIAYTGQAYTYTKLGESDEYKAFIAKYSVDEDGEEYEWDVGIPP